MKTYNPYRIFIQVCIFIHTCFCFSQNYEFNTIEYKLQQYNIDGAIKDLELIPSLKLSIYDKAKKSYLLAKAYFLNDNHDLAFIETLNAKKTFIDINKPKEVAYCNINLLKILSHQNNLKIDINSIIKELEEYAKKSNDYVANRTIYYSFASMYMDKEKGILANKYWDKYISIAKQNYDTLYIAYGQMNKGTVYNDYIKNPDSALFYFKKPLPIFLEKNIFYAIASNYNNQGKAYYNLKKCDKAIFYYLKADSIKIKQNIPKTELVFYENLFKAYKCQKDYKNFSKYLEKYVVLKDSIDELEQDKAIINASEKYKASEKEKQRIINRNIAIGLASSLVLGSIIAFLTYKNTRKKQKLAEQEKALETQKLATVLKEQELISIDAMIEGQEKERQRIANDLHDDLGGLMATVKLHFNVLKDKQTPDLFDKTTKLIDEAYQKIRSIAHAKNSGVIAKQGLLKAIQNMADKISVSNKISIHVVDHKLEDRLENSLELTIFRIIQELVTNIIKHAEATEATIHLTNHDDRLNIMVEDNGKGFDHSQITTKNKGMGISSIDKRIDHLNGTMTIESEINKGTTIIIDIPI